MDVSLTDFQTRAAEEGVETFVVGLQDGTSHHVRFVSLSQLASAIRAGEISPTRAGDYVNLAMVCSFKQVSRPGG